MKANRLELAGRIPPLDGLRGVAILLVVVSHLALQMPTPASWGLFHRLSTAAAQGGWIGVDLFFVLSGFLITGILYDSRSNPGYFRNFFARRILRIFPLYYEALFLVLILAPLLVSAKFYDANYRLPISLQPWLWLYLANVKMSLAAADPHQFKFLFHFWSLSVEEQYYLVWPLFVLALSRRSLVGVCAACLVFAPALRALIYQIWPSRDSWLITFTLTPCRLDSLACGGLAALLARGPLGLGGLTRAAKRTAAASGAILLVIGWMTGLRNDSRLVETAGLSLLAVFFAALLILAAGADPARVPYKLLSTGPMPLLGKYSYGIYVFHFLLIPIFNESFGFPYLYSRLHSWWLAGGIYVAASFAVTFAAAFANWRLWERRWLELKDSL